MEARWDPMSQPGDGFEAREKLDDDTGFFKFWMYLRRTICQIWERNVCEVKLRGVKIDGS